MAPPTSTNPFLSAHKAADAVPAVLHPLVLLSISDHITRHTLRRQRGPVVGALLGQQNGRQVTLEHTFDFVVEENDEGDAYFSAVWFNDRLEQMRTVHKDRQLDLVGWYTVLGRGGPNAQILQVHEQILPLCSESAAAVLLAFHLEDLAEKAGAVGGRLPLTLYETHYEQDEDGSAAAARRAAVREAKQKPTTAATTITTASAGADEQEDKEMTDAAAASSAAAAATGKAPGGSGPSAASPLAVKIREITYTVEMEEAERISIDFVARGVANAAAAESSSGASGAAGGGAAAAAAAATTKSPTSRDGSSGSRDRAVAIESGNRGKRRLVAADSRAIEEEPLEGSNNEETTAAADADGLSREDEELIATLTTRANAVRMLHARLQLLTKYLEALPANALEVPADDDDDEEEDGINEAREGKPAVGVSLPILRSIQALVRRLPLVVPPPVAGAFEEERRREANDVQLVSLLLDGVMQSIGQVRQAGGKFAMLEVARSSNISASGGAGGRSAAAAAAAGMGGGGLGGLGGGGGGAGRSNSIGGVGGGGRGRGRGAGGSGGGGFISDTAAAYETLL